MKGVIAACLADLVKEKFGKDKWEASLEAAGLKKTSFFMPTADVDDSTVMELVGAVCKTLGITMAQAADAFGDYWVNVYAPKIYRTYYRGIDNAKDFLLNMDNVHKIVTEKMANARPPRFTFEQPNDNTLIMNYQSKRPLIDFLLGLVKGVGNHFNEKLTVTKLSSSKLKVVFH